VETALLIIIEEMQFYHIFPYPVDKSCHLFSVSIQCTYIVHVAFTIVNTERMSLLLIEANPRACLLSSPRLQLHVLICVRPVISHVNKYILDHIIRKLQDNR